MARFRCGECGHWLRMRHRPSKGQKIYCPDCGALVYEYAKPLYPPRATQLKKTTFDEHEDHRG